MEKNKELYNFFLKETWNLTEEWYTSLDKTDPEGVYSSKNLSVIETVKQQNYEFHKRFANIFIAESLEDFFEGFEEWVKEIAQDEEHQQTPVHFILREFFNTQKQYLNLVKEFFTLHNQYLSEEHYYWIEHIFKAFSIVMAWFSKELQEHSAKRLDAQQEMIIQLSSPVIRLNSTIGLLPLIGDIDTRRATLILEKTLSQCKKLSVSKLLLDLSGVAIIDTMVAQQIFQLIEALKLIGVKTILSGLRPEMVQTATKLGMNFNDVSIVSNLETAISKYKVFI
ncbi:STAS domain-containing protein [Peribacillus sp. SCS-155]|uniref:STAS domain-containing protein n=1 Tax=Peribacillus sedimenti TaxID=3115297 RepID=UPI003905A975